MGARVNPEQVEKIAAILQKIEFKKAFMKREFLHFDADRETKLRIYFLSAAICHQTRSLHHPGLNLWGWEYMEYGFLQLLKQRNPLLNPGYMSICSNVDVEEVLKMAFSPDKNPDHCTLDRIEERTLMLLEICRSVKTQYNSRISNLIDASEGWLINQGRGLYETLPRLMAFSDPQKKKITFFLKLASDAGVINIKDPENLVPIMDYHMQRVLLRTGCIEVTDSGLREALVHKTRQGSDEPIRSLCIKALRSLAEYSGKDLLAMNDILWPLGRSCCHETTLCKDKYCAKEPCTLTQTVDIESHTTCIFDEVCKGSRDDTYRSLFEPIVETHYY